MNRNSYRIMKTEKLTWQGRLMSVQPRIRLSRSFDQRSHNYLGYALRVEGTIDGQEGEFLVGIGKAAQAKHHFKVGDSISGQSHPVLDNRLEAVEYYKTSGLKVIECSNIPEHDVPPWQGIPPDIETYRERGHRRLAAQTYNVKCQNCLWGCKMAVEMIIDHWNPKQKRFRYETFCYGPKSCALYKAGPTRKVPGRKGMVWEEEDWVDEDDTAHRSMDA